VHSLPPLNAEQIAAAIQKSVAFRPAGHRPVECLLDMPGQHHFDGFKLEYA
jgi:hypothetical protein